MECSCDMSVDLCESETWEIFHNKTVKARKHHACCECGYQISPGDSYDRAGGKYDGDWHYYNTCMDCVDIRKMFFPRGYLFEGLFESLSESIHEADCDLPESCIAELMPRARELVCEEIEKCWVWQEE